MDIPVRKSRRLSNLQREWNQDGRADMAASFVYNIEIYKQSGESTGMIMQLWFYKSWSLEWSFYSDDYADVILEMVTSRVKIVQWWLCRRDSTNDEV